MLEPEKKIFSTIQIEVIGDNINVNSNINDPAKIAGVLLDATKLVITQIGAKPQLIQVPSMVMQ